MGFSRAMPLNGGVEDSVPDTAAKILRGCEYMYQVLYRKWRPKTFDDVTGQPQVTVTLRNELQSGRINHAYLFTGSRGTGKTSCAKIMAKALNCLHPKEGNPCGECELCRGIEDGSVMDIAEIDAASNNSVDNVRSIIEEAAFNPAKAKYRVYIIDEVHMLSVGAFNALLKTLEEPPAHVVFILATTEVHKIPATILSRCQRFDFHRITPENIAKRLLFVAEKEGLALEENAALLIASVSDGAMRDALSLLDRCASADKQITVAVVQNTAGLTGHDYLFEITDCIIRKDTGKILSVVEKLYHESKDMGRLCDELTEHFRNLMIIKTINQTDSMRTFSENEKVKMKEQSDSLTLENIMYAADVLQSGYEKISRGMNKRTEMELSLIKLTSPELNTSVNALLNRISALERTVKRGIFVSDRNIPSGSVADKAENERTDNVLSENEQKINPSAEIKKTSPKATGKTADYHEIVRNAVPFQEWTEVLNVLKDHSITMATAFKNTKAYISGDYLLIDSDNELTFKRLKQSEERERMRKAVLEVTGRVYRLGPYQKNGEESSVKKDTMTEFLNKARNAGIDVQEEE